MKEGSIFFAKKEGFYVLKFVGDVRLTLCTTLDQHIEKVLLKPVVTSVLIDLTEAEGIDSTTLGLIAKVSIRCKSLSLPVPAIVSTNAEITNILLKMGFDRVFVLLDTLPESKNDLEALPLVRESEEAVRKRIIDAHRVLMDLNDDNRMAFKDLVQALESNA